MKCRLRGCPKSAHLAPKIQPVDKGVDKHEAISRRATCMPARKAEEAPARCNNARRLCRSSRPANKPIIACYGWPSSDYFVKDLLAAGAAAAFRIPCGAGTIAGAFRTALSGAAPNNERLMR